MIGIEILFLTPAHRTVIPHGPHHVACFDAETDVSLFISLAIRRRGIIWNVTGSSELIGEGKRMTQLSVLIDTDEVSPARFRAISGPHQSVGRTPGEALDALLAQEGEPIEASAILIQRFAPDAYFTQPDYDRMQELLARRASLSATENDELDTLIDRELDATVARTDALMQRGKR
jgi:hypothetical protein